MAWGAGSGRRWRGVVVLVAVGITLAACGEQALDNPNTVDTQGEVGDEVVPTVLAAATDAATPGTDPVPPVATAGVVGQEAVATPDASPDPAAADAERIAVAIRDGRLDPDRIQVTIDTAVILAVTGDGTARTLAIAGMVDGEEVAAAGTTEIGFTVEGALGDRPVTLDGEEAGTLAVANAAGSTDDPNQDDTP